MRCAPRSLNTAVARFMEEMLGHVEHMVACVAALTVPQLRAFDPSFKSKSVTFAAKAAWSTGFGDGFSSYKKARKRAQQYYERKETSASMTKMAQTLKSIPREDKGRVRKYSIRVLQYLKKTPVAALMTKADVRNVDALVRFLESQAVVSSTVLTCVADSNEVCVHTAHI